MRDRPPHRELRPLFFSISVWVLLCPTELIMKSCETGPTVYRPYPRRLESLTIWRCHYKGGTSSSLSVVPAGLWIWTRDLPHASPVLYHWAKQCLCTACNLWYSFFVLSDWSMTVTESLFTSSISQPFPWQKRFYCCVLGREILHLFWQQARKTFIERQELYF